MTKRTTKKLIYSSLLVLAGVGIAMNLATQGAGCSPAVRKGDRVLLIGDSFGVGTSTHFRVLCEERGVSFLSKAVVGNTAWDWLSGSKLSQAMAFNPTLVIISLGTNDTAGNQKAERISESFRQLLARIQPSGASVIWLLPPTLPFEDRASAAVRALGVPVFESSRLDLPRGPDKLHPSAMGYAAWAGAAWSQMTCEQPKKVSLEGLPREASFVKPVRRRKLVSRRARKRGAGGVFSLRK